MAKITIYDCYKAAKEINSSFLGDKYYGIMYKYPWRCLKCDIIWHANLNNVRNNKTGCPSCKAKLTGIKNSILMKNRRMAQITKDKISKTLKGRPSPTKNCMFSVQQYCKKNNININLLCSNKKKKIYKKLKLNAKISKNLRSNIYVRLKNKVKSGSAVRDLGCTIDQLKIHLESKFKPGMSWDNYGFNGWHIDHVKPLSSFDLANKEEFLKACHYSNLQPLWAKDNLKKSNKLIKEIS